MPLKLYRQGMEVIMESLEIRSLLVNSFIA